MLTKEQIALVNTAKANLNELIRGEIDVLDLDITIEDDETGGKLFQLARTRLKERFAKYGKSHGAQLAFEDTDTGVLIWVA